MRISLLLCAALSFAADLPPDLLDAAKKGRTKDVEALLAKNPDLEVKDKEGRTPLMLAAQYGRTATLQLLLEKGAKLDTRDTHGWNAYMLALLAPSGGLVHTAHDSVLRLLPQPKRFRMQVNAGWSPGKSIFSSCFMRPAELTAHIHEIRPDALVLEALQRFAATSGRELIAIVRADARGTSEQSNLAPATDVDATMELMVEPGLSCVQGVDRLTVAIRGELTRAEDRKPILEKVFGMGVKTGMKTEGANNSNQHAPLYAAWAKSQGGADLLGRGGSAVAARMIESLIAPNMASAAARDPRNALGRSPDRLTLEERIAFSGKYIALEIYTPENLALRRIEAIGDSLAACVRMLKERGLDPRQFEYTRLAPAIR